MKKNRIKDLLFAHSSYERMVLCMSDKKTTNVYDDGNIPDVDLPQSKTNNKAKNSAQSDYEVEPLPESSRPRKDGPGGD